MTVIYVPMFYLYYKIYRGNNGKDYIYVIRLTFTSEQKLYWLILLISYTELSIMLFVM